MIIVLLVLWVVRGGYADVVRKAVLAWGLYCSCRIDGEVLTCEGEGTLSQADVDYAGDRARYKQAIVGVGISTIEDGAFVRCGRLISVSLPNGLMTIERGAFQYCPFRSLDIPKSVLDISYSSVSNCPFFENFTVNGNVNGYLSNHMVRNGLLLNRDGELIASPCGKMAGETLALPLGIDIVGGYSCRNARANIIAIPSSVTSIEPYAFYGAYMETLVLGSAVSSFATNALFECNYMKDVIVGQNRNFFMENNIFRSSSTIIKVFEPANEITNADPAKTFATGALQSCSTLTSITFRSTNGLLTQRSILNNQIIARWITRDSRSEWAIVGCVGGATTIDLEALSATEKTQYTWIYNEAFRGCRLLRTLRLHSKITKVNGGFARDCANLTSFSFTGCYCGNANSPGSTGNNVIPYCSFTNSPLVTVISWPNGNNFTIGRNAFTGCDMSAINFPTGLTSIGNYAFSNAPVTELIFNDKLERICGHAFEGCAVLTTIIFSLNSHLKYVELWAFACCTSLTTVRFPDTVLDISPSCFAKSSSMTSITFMGNTNPRYRSDGVACYEVASGNPYKTLAICPPGLETFQFVQQTAVIGTYAFYYCSKLVQVIISDTVNTIKSGAFFCCDAIELIQLPSTVKLVEDDAFSSCRRLKHILYCSNTNTNIACTGDAFPTNSNVYLFYNYPYNTFCGHSCWAILDWDCNIPTMYFTMWNNDMYQQRPNYFHGGRLVYTLFLAQ